MSVELPGPVRAAIDAVNANDFSAFSASFTSDGVVDDWGVNFAAPTFGPGVTPSSSARMPRWQWTVSK
ncbi:MAG: hypothetical protein ACJA07_003973 [Rhodococcus sp. (in: high G+C Gram-positive bacteria)]|jgi:hypothetical protein